MAKSFGELLKKGGPVVLTSRIGGIPEVILVAGKELAALELLSKFGIIKLSRITDDKVLNSTSAVEVKKVVGTLSDKEVEERAERCRKRMRR